MDERGATVGQVGETGVVARILEILGVDPAAPPDTGPPGGSIVGPGDDAAVLIGGENMVLSTDSQHEGVHFRSEWVGPRMLGRRSIAINASDVGAMGATPVAFLVSLALPSDTRMAWVESLASGMRDGAARWGASIVGGDVAGVPGAVAINVTAVGECKGAPPVLRSGAREGDRIYVTGRPGRAAAGLELLRSGRRLDDPPDSGEAVVRGEAEEACLRAFLDPSPPVVLGGRAAGTVQAMMDISDGLAMDLGRMCRASGVGAVLEAASLRDDEVLGSVAETLGVDALDWVLHGGEDYELLCAIGEEDEAAFRELAGAVGVEVRDVGSFVHGAELIELESAGRRRPVSAAGWDHFSESAITRRPRCR